MGGSTLFGGDLGGGERRSGGLGGRDGQRDARLGQDCAGQQEPRVKGPLCAEVDGSSLWVSARDRRRRLDRSLAGMTPPPDNESMPADPQGPLHADQLTTRLHGELRDLARARLRQGPGGSTVEATALVHEAWCKLRDDGTFADRSAFFGAAARAMKDVLIDRWRARMAQKRGGGRAAAEIDEQLPELTPAVPIADLLSLDEALQRLQKDHPDEAEVVLRRFFAGQSHAEIAADLGTSERTIERRWRFARALLAQHLGHSPETDA